MKNFFTILAIAVVSTSAFAQKHDLSVVFSNHLNGAEVTNPVNLSYTITNQGLTPILTGDSLVFGYSLNTTPYVISNSALIPGFYTVILTEDLVSGGTVNQNMGVSISFPASSGGVSNIDLCAFSFHKAIGFDITKIETYTIADSSPLNNISCIKVELPLGMDDNLNSITNKMYVANGELVLDNGGYNFEKLVNFSVIDLTGRTVLKTSVELNGRTTFSLANYTPGIYFVRVEVGSHISTKKVFVK
jgi:hypothetical protein